MSYCKNPDVSELVFKSIQRHPRSLRCKWCRPVWSYGIRPWTLLGRVVAFFWPAHVIGSDYGSVHGYTDVMCTIASAKINGRLDDGKC